MMDSAGDFDLLGELVLKVRVTFVVNEKWGRKNVSVYLHAAADGQLLSLLSFLLIMSDLRLT